MEEDQDVAVAVPSGGYWLNEFAVLVTAVLAKDDKHARKLVVHERGFRVLMDDSAVMSSYKVTWEPSVLVSPVCVASRRWRQT